jgi:hypothetical protein
MEPPHGSGNDMPQNQAQWVELVLSLRQAIQHLEADARNSRSTIEALQEAAAARSTAEAQPQAEQRANAATDTPTTTPNVSTETIATRETDPRPRRKPLAWPAKFEGDKTCFPAWKASMLHKLEADAEIIGS